MSTRRGWVLPGVAVLLAVSGVAAYAWLRADDAPAPGVLHWAAALPGCEGEAPIDAPAARARPLLAAAVQRWGETHAAGRMPVDDADAAQAEIAALRQEWGLPQPGAAHVDLLDDGACVRFAVASEHPAEDV